MSPERARKNRFSSLSSIIMPSSSTNSRILNSFVPRVVKQDSQYAPRQGAKGPRLQQKFAQNIPFFGDTAL